MGASGIGSADVAGGTAAEVGDVEADARVSAKRVAEELSQWRGLLDGVSGTVAGEPA